MSEEIMKEVKGKKVVLSYFGADLLGMVLENITNSTIKDIVTLGDTMKTIHGYVENARMKIRDLVEVGEMKKIIEAEPPLELSLTEEQFNRIKVKIRQAFDEKGAISATANLEKIEDFLAQFDLTE